MLTCVGFSEKLMFTAYGDGLICSWKCDLSMYARHVDKKVQEAELYLPLMGHVNKVNALVPIMGKNRLYSCSNDCTIRLWDTEKGICDLVYKFSDPIYTALYDRTRDMLFTGGWDKQIRAIDIKDGIVD